LDQLGDAVFSLLGTSWAICPRRCRGTRCTICNRRNRRYCDGLMPSWYPQHRRRNWPDTPSAALISATLGGGFDRLESSFSKLTARPSCLRRAGSSELTRRAAIHATTPCINCCSTTDFVSGSGSASERSSADFIAAECRWRSWQISEDGGRRTDSSAGTVIR
jgi:hypothetical protein